MSDKKIRFSVKAVINKQKTRVLFAEIDNNFADILVRFSTLSLGLVIRALLKHFRDKTPVIGCLNNLYKSLQKIYSNADDWLYLNYETVYKYELFNAFPSDKIKYNCYASENEYFSFLKIFFQDTSFVIREDLQIVNKGEGSILESLNNAGVAVEDMDGSEIINVTIGVNEIMDFLARLFISRCPLADIILGTAVDSELAKIKPEAAAIPLHNAEKNAPSNHKMMILKLTLQKSTNKLLFAQAGHDFVNYLFSVLLIPLGRVDYHFGGIACLKNVDSLCTSVADYLGAHKINIEDTNLPFRPFVHHGMYIINDDLSVTSISLVSGLSVLNELKISLSDVKEVELQIGIEEVLSILKASLTSTTALTDGLINPRSKKLLKPKQEN